MGAFKGDRIRSIACNSCAQVGQCIPFAVSVTGSELTDRGAGNSCSPVSCRRRSEAPYSCARSRGSPPFAVRLPSSGRGRFIRGRLEGEDLTVKHSGAALIQLLGQGIAIFGDTAQRTVWPTLTTPIILSSTSRSAAHF